MELTQFGDFIGLPFKFDNGKSVIRYLFVKKHEGQDDVKPSDRTLYVVNIPQVLSGKGIKEIFKDCGDIEHVYIHSKPQSKESDSKPSKYFDEPDSRIGCKVAYIVFKIPSSLNKVFHLCSSVQIVSSKLRRIAGKRKWAIEYNSNFIDTERVKKEVEEYMKEYDKRIEEEIEKAKKMDGIADEGGWITVTKHSKRSKIPGNKAANSVSEKRVQKKTLLNFYRCQLRETKMEHIAELQKKFEKDKMRIALMRANRKFKPF